MCVHITLCTTAVHNTAQNNGQHQDSDTKGTEEGGRGWGTGGNSNNAILDSIFRP